MEGHDVPRLGLLVQASGEGTGAEFGGGQQSWGLSPSGNSAAGGLCLWCLAPWEEWGKAAVAPEDLHREPPPLPTSAWPCAYPAVTRWTPPVRLREPAVWP